MQDFKVLFGSGSGCHIMSGLYLGIACDEPVIRLWFKDWPDFVRVFLVKVDDFVEWSGRILSPADLVFRVSKDFSEALTLSEFDTEIASDCSFSKIGC